MDQSLLVLCAAAAGVGLVHTAIGPDHYLPFIAMARAGGWSLAKTAMVTLLCGVGHVLGSVAIASAGAAIGSSISSIEAIESLRGDMAAWFLIAFGSAYAVWGLRRAYRRRPHTHWHVHEGGIVHTHEHAHEREHLHVHEPAGAARLTPWVLFTFFLFGPCEPLIPLVMYPAAKGDWWQAVPVVLSFTVTTLATMLGIVVILHRLGGRFRGLSFQPFGHALAGCVVLGCGVAIKLGL